MKTRAVIFIVSLFQMASCRQAAVDEVTSDFSVDGKKVYVFTTADSTNLRLSPTDTLQFVEHGHPLETEVCVVVDPSKEFQNLVGIGGALTDASAETLFKLPEFRQQELLKAYYDKNIGINYTLARTNINSCDFSSATYTYVNESDNNLKSFNILHDKQFKIPLIKKAIATAGGKLTLFASPWSPPAWMKDNNDMLHGGKLKPNYFQSWANYYVKFTQAYKAEGIPLWGLTVQNEPMATQKWESCIYTADEERDFIKNYLGPTLKKEGLSDLKLIAWDHNRDLIYQRTQTLYNDPLAAQYIWGVGFHWYEDWSGGDQLFDNVKKVNESWPNKNLIFTEGCNSPFSKEGLMNWKLGERYGLSMINDFNNGAVAWTDWNILLDENGGPNHVQNFCFAPIHADTKTGKLIYTNAYYYIGHFSKFLNPGAKRISSSSSRSHLNATSFLNPDGKLVVVVMNATAAKMPYYLLIKQKVASVTALPHSISTLIIQ